MHGFKKSKHSGEIFSAQKKLEKIFMWCYDLQIGKTCLTIFHLSLTDVSLFWESSMRHESRMRVRESWLIFCDEKANR
jgi:hypothetical protein